jgi:thioredoxin reductase (NADPH)
MDFEAAVIGAGPGGLVSALYLRRFLRETILVSGGTPRATWIPKTHNLLGYRGGISGVELLRRLHNQIDEVGVQKVIGEFQVWPMRGGFRVRSPKEEFTAKKVILATGVTDINPDIANLNFLRRLGLLRYCPICDAYEYRNKHLAVLAKDDHGLREALFIARYSKSLDIIYSGEKAPSGGVAKKCLSLGMRMHHARLLHMHEKKGRQEGLEITIGTLSAKLREKTIHADACYVGLGSQINDRAFAEMHALRRSELGYLQVGHHQELPISGLFAVGDCVEGLSQITVAAGQAAIAATRIHNELRG